jgi:hypothetical protein
MKNVKTAEKFFRSIKKFLEFFKDKPFAGRRLPQSTPDTRERKKKCIQTVVGNGLSAGVLYLLSTNLVC